MFILVPVFLKITLPEGVNTVWAGVNVANAVAGFILSESQGAGSAPQTKAAFQTGL